MPSARYLGVNIRALIESDEHCVQTLQLNGFTNIVRADIREVDFTQYKGTDILTGGLPCQPFSISGRDSGAQDPRNLWAEAVRAIEEMQPRMFLFEMVRGFLRPKFRSTVKRVLAAIRAQGYQVKVYQVNAADYGVPQNRKRCLLIGHLKPGRLRCPPRIDAPVTVASVLDALGPPNGVNRHTEQGSAREYEHHRPSKLSAPAKTVRAGTNGPGGGCNTVRLANGASQWAS